MTRITGTPASPGVALGHAFLVDRRRARVPRYHIEPEVVPRELERLRLSVKLAAEQLTAIRESLGEGEQGLILDAQKLMAMDPTLSANACNLVEEELLNAEWAVRRSFREIAEKLGASQTDEDAFFAERRNDFEEVCDRIVHNLAGETPSSLAFQPPEGAILVAFDLPTAEAAVLLASGRVRGLVIEFGSRTSHTSILARAMEVPCVVGATQAVERCKAGELVALDGDTGEVLLDPAPEEIGRVEEARVRAENRGVLLLEQRDLPAETKDGRTMALFANIEFPEEVPSVLAHGGEGIGLYRTEFLYLNREELPSEDEHFRAYSNILKSMGNRSVTIRTLDLGGDKLPIGHRSHEQNPALGLRAIRLTQKHPALFRTQARALWRASVFGNLRVMLPMITFIAELREAKTQLQAARAELVREGVQVAEELPLGIMVETPAAAICADRLALECDFFSIGTNDLIQYTLAIDRQNRDVAHLYKPLHLAILRMIASCISGARAAGIEVAMCGEMAGDPAYALLLLALGLDSLSMSPADIPKVKRVLRGAELADAKAMLDAALSFDSADEIERFVHAEMQRRFPELS